jgi:phosphatidylserine/phosphatidylglycerophosphate/cardiolipin synthase-like enzyme
LVQYPTAGFSGIYAQTAAARVSITMEMYELADTTEESALAAAVARGVSVRVLLDSAFSGHSVNTPAFTYLGGHGVSVRWALSGAIFHIKATTFDGATADVSSANLTSKYYATTRDAEIIDTDPAQVHAIAATFTADWAATSTAALGTGAVQAPGLVWSPDTDGHTAETALVTQINAAQHSVDFESEELSDAAVYQALAADARRGVTCEVTMTNSSDWDAGFAAITASGCHVHVYQDSASALYIHEKLILDDAGTPQASLLIGSQNASATSLTRNRELSLLLTAEQAPTVLADVTTTFGGDYNGASAWQATPSTHPAPTHPSTPHLSSSAPRVAPTSPTKPSCTPLTNAGNCYTPGEMCRTSDRGHSGIDKDGDPITCENNNGWRWERS